MIEMLNDILGMADLSDIVYEQEGLERWRKDYGDISGLAKSIKDHGLLHPLPVNMDENGVHVVRCGGRRYLAMKEAGIQRFPIRVLAKDLSPRQLRMIELEENVQRKNFTFDEELSLKKELFDIKVEEHKEEFAKEGKSITKGEKWGLKEMANLTGESISSVSKDLKLARAMEQFPELKKSENKYEAQKKLDKIRELLITEEQARRAKSRMEKPGVDKKAELMKRFILQDFFTGIKSVANSSVHFIELDPPYGIDYTKTKKFVDEGRRDTDQYNEISADQYSDFIKRVLIECHRVLKDGGWMVIWHADEWHYTITTILKELNLSVPKIPAIWVKSDGVGGQTMSPETNLANTYESFLYVRKGNALIKKKGRSNVFSFDRVLPSKRRHPTIRPIPLITELLETFTSPGDVVMVPFLGSGNTLLACANTHRECFGFEISKAYHDSFIVEVDGKEYGSYE